MRPSLRPESASRREGIRERMTRGQRQKGSSHTYWAVVDYAEKHPRSGEKPCITASHPTIAQAARSGSALGRRKGLRGVFGLIKRMRLRVDESLSVACVGMAPSLKKCDGQKRVFIFTSPRQNNPTPSSPISHPFQVECS